MAWLGPWRECSYSRPPPPPPTDLTKSPNQGGGGRARGFSPPVLYAVYIKHCPGVSLCPSSQIACTEWRHGERRRRVEKALCTLYNRVDWFSTFCDFQKLTHCCQSGLFLSVQFKKTRQNGMCVCVLQTRQSLNSLKITRTLQIYTLYIYFYNLQMPFLFQRNYLNFNTFFRPSKWGTLFLTWSKENYNLFVVSLNF